MGYNPSDGELTHLYEKFTKLADKKKEVFDDDLRVLMGDEVHSKEDTFELLYLNFYSGTTSIPTATVRVKADEKIYEDSAIGDGPVDALFNAIDRALKLKTDVESYQVRSVTSGRKAMGEVFIRIREDDRSFTGRGVSTDIIEASGKAYLQAINQKELYKSEKNNLENKEALQDAV